MTPHRRGDDRGSISIVFLVVMLGLMLSALLVPTIVTSVRASTFDETRVQALGAAQAGIDVTLGLIRTASEGLVGDPTKLPCDTVGGSVGGTPPASYQVVVEYFTFDPALEVYPSEREMTCVAGLGPNDDPTGTATTPAYVRITSTGGVDWEGKGASAPRTLSTTYALRTLDQATPGGLVRIAPLTANLCLDVGAAPGAGTPVVLQPCDTSPQATAQQKFVYTRDLTLRLKSSETAPDKVSLCIERTPAPTGEPVTVWPCAPSGQPVLAQQWGYHDDGRYHALEADSVSTGTLPDLCLTADTPSGGTPATGRAVALGPCGPVLRSPLQNTYER